MRRRILDLFLQKLGLTLVSEPAQDPLDCLLSHENITQKELADTCWLDTTTLSRVLHHMENAGLIRRNQHPGCRRSYQISLTEQGKKKRWKFAGDLRRWTNRSGKALNWRKWNSF